MLHPDSKVAIYVDSLDVTKRRYSYWDRYLDKQAVCATYVSIPELAEEAGLILSSDATNEQIDRVKRKQPRLDGFQVILLNWDVANGDFAFGADKTLSYFETRGREEILRWARQGARVVIEIQATAGFPLQQAYDAILGVGIVEVTPYGRTKSWEDLEDGIVLSRRRRMHPIIREVLGDHDRVIKTHYAPFDHIVFPRFDKANESSFARNAAAFSWGNFVRWEKGWMPLIFRPRGTSSHLPWYEALSDRLIGRPIALVKPVGELGGEIIVTTMRIANAAPEEMVDAVLEFGEKQRERSRKFHKQQKISRVIRRTSAVAIAWLLGLFIAFPAFGLIAGWLNSKVEGQLPSISRWLASLGQERIAEWIAKYGKDIQVIDFAAIAVAISLVGLSRRIWRTRDRS